MRSPDGDLNALWWRRRWISIYAVGFGIAGFARSRWNADTSTMDKLLPTSSSFLPQPLKLWLASIHLGEMVAEADSKEPLETGGILIGYWSESAAVVTAIVGPGPAAMHRRRSFVPDSLFHRIQIKDHFESSGGISTYLGDWHTHPGAAAYMSRRDRSTLARIASFESAAQPKPIMLIMAGSEGWSPKAWVGAKRTWWSKSNEKELSIEAFVPEQLQ